MNIVEDIVPLTEFKRHTARYLDQMRRHGRPLVLTVNGRAELVVQGADGFQQLSAIAGQAEVMAALRQSIDAVDRGAVTPATEAFAALRKKHAL